MWKLDGKSLIVFILVHKLTMLQVGVKRLVSMSKVTP